MKFRVFRSQAWLVALVALAGALALHYIFNHQTDHGVTYSDSIKSNLKEQLGRLDQNATLIEAQLSTIDSKVYPNFPLPTQYPYYVFLGDSILFWSDFEFVPDHHMVQGDYRYKFIKTDNFQFISRKTIVPLHGSMVELYTLLTIYESRPIQNNYIKSEFNRKIFPTQILSLLDTGPAIGDPVFASDSTYLFSISVRENSTIRQGVVPYFVAGLCGLALLFSILYLIHFLRGLIQKNAWEKGLLVLLGGLALIRVLMLYFDFPFHLAPLKLFDPQLYASSDINHSLGDLLLNELALAAVIFYVFKYYRKFAWYQKLAAQSEEFKIGLVSVLMLLGFLTLYFQYYIITLFYHSQWSLDVVTIIDFSFFKFISLFIIVLNAILYFLITHIVVKESMRLTDGSRNKLLLCFLIATGSFLLFSLFSESHYLVILLVHTGYLFLLYFLDFPRYFGQFNYVAFLYLFAVALVSAVVGAYAITNFEKIKNINSKQRFADRLLNERDIQGEWLLSEAATAIQQDAFIKNQMLFSPLASKSNIIQKINQIHLNKHLDQYDISINIFDSRGNPDPGNEEIFSYQGFQTRFQSERYRTEYDGLYFINEIKSDLLKRYLSFIDIRMNGVIVGYVIMDLKLKRVIPNTVYPELLVYNDDIDVADRSYSYAIYANQILINNSGSFNYDKDFKNKYFRKGALYDRGFTIDGYHHLAVDGSKDKVAVISSPAYPIRNVLANFSFLFILFIFSIIAAIIFYIFLLTEQKVKLNYASRIQLYLNLAFFIPLLIVSATTLSLISSSSKKEVILNYFKKAEGISNNIVNTLDSYIKGVTNQEVLTQTLTRIARYSESDINLFNTSGRLIATSQPRIYDYGLLSEYINPKALIDIKEAQSGSVLLDEAVSTLPYKSAYVGIKSFEDGRLLGIISIPFFESKYEENKQIVIVLTNILNIFTFVFIIILVISYFASRLLTVPLRLITQKIKRTTLTGHNEPLVWNSQDEIGLMVGEYNRMLKNLENSKKALAQSEKELAWREMAKQVAHEIKNPLTPMKLTLQHLQRVLKDKENNKEAATDKPINTLLEQIDTLSDIATSFSSFAQMPIPKHERFELSVVLKKIVQLYKNNENQIIHSHLEPGDYYVMGDSQLMGRIFSNLIINGLQSVPGSRKAKIEVHLKRVGDNAVVEIKDNGIGIDDKIADKVFIPNFSTKETGSGIGLSIAKRGVEHAGGSIWYETVCDQGTSIFVKLPLTP